MVASEHRRIASPVMVDREEELGLIERLLDEAIDGTPRVVLVGGEPGIGKSRLVEEALERARRRELRVLRCGCLSLARDIPYLPFVEMLRAVAGELPTGSREAILGPAADELALLAPELAPGTSAAPGGPPPRPSVVDEAAGFERLRLFDAVLRIIERLAADDPVVAVIDDLQWADQASLALLSYVLHGLRHGRVLVLATLRTDEMGSAGLELLADLERDDRVERLELRGLNAAHVAQQVAAIRGHRPDRPLLERILTLSGGNPFYVEEVLATEGDSGQLPADEDARVELSPRLRDILRARIDGLPPDALHLLRVIATTDRPVDGRLLAEVSAMGSDRLEGGLRVAVGEQILVASPERDYRFRHELMRAFVASEVLPTEAARLHAAFAERLASMPTIRRSPGELAFHWDAAGNEPRAFAAHVDAGLEAERAFAFAEAYRHLARALELWDRVADADDRVGLERLALAQHAAEAAALAGDLDRAIELARSILGQADEADGDLLAHVRSRLRWYLWQAGRIDEAVAEADRAVVASVGARDDCWRANAIAHLAGLRLQLGDIARARRGATDALALAQALGAWQEAALAQGILGWCLVAAGHVEDGIEQITAVWDAAHDHEPHDLTGVALAYEQLASALELGGREDEAADVAARGGAWSGENGMERTYGRVLQAVRARALYHLGRWSEAEAALATGIDLGPIGFGAAALQASRALLAAAVGREDDVSEAWSIALALEHEDVALGSAGWLAAGLAEHALWRGDPELALERLGVAPVAHTQPGALSPTGASIPAGRRLFDASRPRRLALTAWALADAATLARGGRPVAGERLTVGLKSVGIELRHFGRRPALAAAWRPELDCAVAESVRATRPGSRREVAVWERAAASAANRGRPYAEAYASWRLTEAMLAARADRAHAAHVLRRGLSLATGLGAAPLVREIELLATRARLERARPTQDAVAHEAKSAAPFGLTERELEVLALLAEGESNRGIGEKLFISPRTVSVHVSNILGKMGVDGRVEAAAIAHRLGLAG